MAAYVVDTQDRHKPADAPVLADNIARAQILGATVVRVRSDDVAEGLSALAHREGVTHVVLGSPNGLRSLVDPGSIIGAFVARSTGMEVQVVGSSAGVRRLD